MFFFLHREANECWGLIAQDRDLCERVIEVLLEHLLHRTPYDDKHDYPMASPKENYKWKEALIDNVGVSRSDDVIAILMCNHIEKFLFCFVW